MRLRAVLLAARFHAAKVEQIFHQPMQTRGFAIEEYVALLTARFVRDSVLHQELGDGTQGCEWGAKFVRDGSDEVRLKS